MSARAAEEFAKLREKHSKDPVLGCSLAAHRDLGFCLSCTDSHLELSGWRLLAMAERGIPDQPGASTRKGG